MDGHFVPNISIGPAVTAAVRRSTQLPLDCHLMIEEPQRSIPAFVEAGADMISVHVEAERHLHRAVATIRSHGRKAGVVLNPGTPLGALDGILRHVDYVLLMSVDPGFGGQEMIRSVLDKVRDLRAWIERERLHVRIEIDGGVNETNLDDVARSGVDMIVAGSAVFGSGDVRGTTARMVRRLAELGQRERTC